MRPRLATAALFLCALTACTTGPDLVGIWSLHDSTTIDGRTLDSTMTYKFDGPADDGGNAVFDLQLVVSTLPGCSESITANGSWTLSDDALQASFPSGTDTMTGCKDPSKNYPSQVLDTSIYGNVKGTITVAGDTLTIVKDGGGKLTFMRQQ